MFHLFFFLYCFVCILMKCLPFSCMHCLVSVEAEQSVQLHVLLTCQHQRTHTFHPALHGSFHQRGEAMAVSSFNVQPRVVVEQIVGDRYVAFNSREINNNYSESERSSQNNSSKRDPTSSHSPSFWKEKVHIRLTNYALLFNHRWQEWKVFCVSVCVSTCAKLCV